MVTASSSPITVSWAGESCPCAASRVLRHEATGLGGSFLSGADGNCQPRLARRVTCKLEYGKKYSVNPITGTGYAIERSFRPRGPYQ
jgi:hypothetical protein